MEAALHAGLHAAIRPTEQNRYAVKKSVQDAAHEGDAAKPKNRAAA